MSLAFCHFLLLCHRTVDRSALADQFPFCNTAPFSCAGYLAHPFVKWMVLVLIAPFFSQLSFFTDEEVQERFAYLHACSESHPLPQRRWQREGFFQALQKQHGGTRHALSSGSVERQSFLPPVRLRLTDVCT